MTYALAGERALAQAWLARSAAHDTTGQWVHFLTTIAAKVAEAVLALDQLDTTTAGRLIDELGDGSVAVELWPLVANLNARYRLLFDDPAVALATLSAAERLHRSELRPTPAMAWRLRRSRIELQLAGGLVRQAGDLLEEMPTPPTGDQPTTDPVNADPMNADPLAIPRAKWLLAVGDNAGALAYVKRALWNGSVSRRDRTQLTVLGAAAARHLGRTDEAATMARAALQDTARDGTLRAWAAIPGAERDQITAMEYEGLASPSLPSIRNPYPRPEELAVLSPAQHLLLLELARRDSRQEIADSLHVSVNTVKTRLSHLYAKMRTTNRKDTLEKASAQGLLVPLPALILKPRRPRSRASTGRRDILDTTAGPTAGKHPRRPPERGPEASTD